jgi:hypothetical protein
VSHKVLELRGIKSLRALNGFHALMLGLKMLPAYMTESYEDFYARVDAMPHPDQEKLIREAVLFVELGADEVHAIASFCADPNGVPYSEVNLRGMPTKDLFEVLVAVCVEIAKIKIDIVSDSQKKNLPGSALTSDERSQKTPG